jgi:hypothetical protein
LLTAPGAVFRALMPEPGLRPVHHRTAERAEGHLFIPILADRFVQVVGRRVQAQGINDQ